MNKLVVLSLTPVVFAALAFAAQDVASAVVGTVKTVDSTSKKVVVKTADGTERTFHFVGRTTVHGATAAAKGTKDAFHGVKEGSEVAVHYTKKGAEETADEVGVIGKDGMKATEGTVKAVDHGGKKVVIKTAEGTEETYHLAGRAGKDIGKGAEKAGKVTVYYTEEGGRKVAHFFKNL